MDATPPGAALDFAAVRQMFGGHMSQLQVDGINTIIGAFEAKGDGNKRHLAYLLATAFHETARTMQPIHERGSRAYFNKYEPGRKLGNALGNILPGDGFKFRGRGFVQLTGRHNYVVAGRKLGRDLLADADDALLPEVAADILVIGCLEGWFTGKKLGDYSDFRNMRRVINGLDRADLIATYANTFLGALGPA